MDDSKILLVKLSKGRLGEMNQRLLGMFLTNKIALSAFSREDIRESDRTPFYFYIDEFQNFTTESIKDIVSEARKYKLGLTMAHQYIEQLPEDIRSAIFGNVGTMISFRVGIDGAELLHKQFSPSFSARDLTQIKNLNAAVRLLADGTPVDPFSMTIRYVDRGNSARKDYMREISFNRYARDIKEIEEEMKHTLDQ